MSKPAQDAAFSRPAVAPVWIEGGAQCALQGIVAPDPANPAATSVNTDYAFKWSGGAVVNHVLLQNNGAAAINYDIDEAASLGSMSLGAGSVVFLDIQMAALHFYTGTAMNVNGTTGSNIVVRAWS